jgi:uncharacterized linocin/CFP29 family protein
VNDLHRELAPIDDAAWSLIDETARSVLQLNFAARRLVDFRGPLGWSAAAVPRGTLAALPAGPLDAVDAALREAQPLVELRTSFRLARTAIDAVARGARDADVQPLVDAAVRLARAEDRAVFHGYAAGRIHGIAEASPHAPLAIAADYERYPAVVAQATGTLREAGVGGPYAIALGPRCFAGLMQATAGGGYPIFEIVRRLLDGPVVWAPALDGAVVMRVDGGDFELTVGRDVAIGYADHDAGAVALYLVETMTFQALNPPAAVALVYAS